MKSLWTGYLDALKSANWLVAMTCCRALFEEIAHFYLHNNKILKNSNQTKKLLAAYPKLVGASEQKIQNWNSEFITLQLETIERLRKSLEGSDFDWASFIYELTGRESSEHVETEAVRKTHSNDALRALKKGPIPKSLDYYDLLSEFVHPNFGSGTLVIETRKKANEVQGDVTINSHPQNLEAACWFFDITSSAMKDILKVARSSLNLVNQQLDFYQSFSLAFDSQLPHGRKIH
ncbi:hypothetical protein [Alteromonas sp. CYL-A6]|uniref:hypothetical protein n=1 Tax=Alteromonas nitratireducens TaxID=3390813 RepID=UPI0034BE7F65